ncbi:MAG: ribonuclease P [Halobacteriales archaeon SW_8_66_22]|jgi:ribonuclease P protein subunit POP4|nr:MAG: ribonuclease P [Halobacteriales archaeon QH_7_66_37]PSQ35037.1 MAG: ribonuclease P [Halobacteriales archaeon SW_10_66_29]PSQ62856.1 MAG: ribonuclease P [Halobacteriales archaeon SW_8_66_22]
MALTAETLVRHELVGLDVRVVSASNPDVIDVSGEVVTETTRTLGIETDGQVSHVPKESATFEWTLPSGEVVRTAGERLLARPARRTEQTGDSRWR